MRHVRHRDWGWVREQSSRGDGESLAREAKRMRQIRGPVRVRGRCYEEGPRGAFCDLSHWYALTFRRTSGGNVIVHGLFVQD